MLPPAAHRAIAVIAGALLAGLVTLFPTARADAQVPDIDCKSLSGAKATTTLTVDGGDRTYPRLTATTDYEIPFAWPGGAALLGRAGDEKHQAALRCFITLWPLDQISQVGEYRQQPPTVQIKEATQATNGREATPEWIVLHDEVIGDLNSRTAPPLLGPWEVAILSHHAERTDHLELELIDKETKDYQELRPQAFDSIEWTVQTQLFGLRFDQLMPIPVSTDNEKRVALWRSLKGDERDALRISVKLDAPTSIAIATGNGKMNAFSHTSFTLINIYIYGMLLFLLRRSDEHLIAKTDTDDSESKRIRRHVRVARCISILGLALGIVSAAAYWRHGIDTGFTTTTGFAQNIGFNGRGMPIEYWKLLGLISVCTVGLIILILAFRERRALARCTSLIAFALLLIVYGVVVLTSPEWFHLKKNFSPMEKPAELTMERDHILTYGGQLILMISLTCAVLFVTMIFLHFLFSSIQSRSKPYAKEKYSVLLRRFLVLSLLASLALMSQWVYQQIEFWNRNHVFPTSADDRSSQLIAEVIGRMVTYHSDLFAELTMNLVPWGAVAAIILMLRLLGRNTAASLRPSKREYQLIGLLFAAVVVTTSSSYVGFAVPIPYFFTFVIVGLVLPWTYRFNLLKKTLKNIPMQHCYRTEDQEDQAERELLKMLHKPTNLRNQLVDQQVEMDLLRDWARSLDAKLSSGEMTVREHRLERKEIESSLARIRFPSASVAFATDDSSEIPQRRRSRWRRPFMTSKPRVVANDPIDPKEGPWSVRPVDTAFAIGPGNGWWNNGLRAARIGAFVSIPATIYFSYIKTQDGRIASLSSYLGLLRLLESIVWEVGFCIVAAFVLGCLWTTLPRPQGPVKGIVLWLGFAIPFTVDLILRRELLGQNQNDEALAHLLVLLLELPLVGLALDWATLRDADIPRIHNWQSLITFYSLRGLTPTAATLAVVVPLILTAIGIYFQVTSGASSPIPDTIQAPSPPPPGTPAPLGRIK